MSLAAAVMPLAVVSTVVLMPLLAPLLIPGLTVSSWAIGRPLLVTVLLPLVVGVAIRVYAPRVADGIFSVVEEDRGALHLAPAGVHPACSTGARSSPRWAASPSARR